MTTSAPLVSSAALVALALFPPAPVQAQSNSTGQVERPLPRPITSDPEAKPLVKPPIDYTKKSAGDWVEVSAVSEAESSPFLRSNVDPALGTKLTFEAVPGGVVFGLAAHFADAPLGEAWKGSRVERGESGWQLRASDGRTLVLPKDNASFIGAALAFASTRAVGDWLVDIGGDGSIHLSYPLANTEAGMVAARGDLAPQVCLPIFAGGKSLIVDRDVRLRVAEQRLLFEADLEVRFYRPQRDPGGPELADRVGTFPLIASTAAATGALSLTAPEGPQAERLASYLHRVSDLAAWIGFFRWAQAAEVEGLDEFGRALASEAKPIRTPLKIDRAESATWVAGGTIRMPAQVPDWMKQHEERVLAD